MSGKIELPTDACSAADLIMEIGVELDFAKKHKQNLSSKQCLQR